MLNPGTSLGPCQILAQVGAGWMGKVYRAYDMRLGRDVAIKVLASHLTASPWAHARFDREARTISLLDHPRICTLHDIGREGETDFRVITEPEVVDRILKHIARGRTGHEAEIIVCPLDSGQPFG